MSKINEIMGALELCKLRPDRMNFSALELMIAAALADARREGAEEMRGAAGDAAQRAAGRGLSASAVHLCIRALPLPTGPRQSVLLTDEQIERAVDGHGWTVSELQVEDIPGMARDIEAAVLAANNLGVRRG